MRRCGSALAGTIANSHGHIHVHPDGYAHSNTDCLADPYVDPYDYVHSHANR